MPCYISRKQRRRDHDGFYAICPGWIRTPPTEGILAADPRAEARMLTHQPIGRLGEAAEVGQAVVWLCSEKASLILGVAMPVDGGYVIV
jgi:NAD(P)-dependent dehydrogenase (short-subunit alcohol dehydrogenase family)